MKKHFYIFVLAIIITLILLMIFPANDLGMLAYAIMGAGIDLLLLSGVGYCLLWFMINIRMPKCIAPEAIVIIPAIGFIILWYAHSLPFTHLIFPYFSERVFQILLGG